MREFKAIFSFGVIVLFLVGVMIVHYMTPSRTVDFRGEILSIATSESGTVTVLATTAYGGDYLFKIDSASKLINTCGDRIASDSLAPGDMIDISYRKLLFKDEKPYTVKTLKVYK